MVSVSYAYHPSPEIWIRPVPIVMRTIGTGRIQIPFTAFILIDDVDFLILIKNVPTLLSMRDMVVNMPDISI